MADERMPKGSCPECYVAGTPERPVCSPHGHDVMLGSVTVCDPHDHAARRVAPSPTEDFVDRLEQAVHPEGRCADCGGGKPYWKHDRAALADYHPFVAPSPDAPGLREAAQNVVDRAHINMERKDAGLDPLPTRVSELERVLAASADAPREGLDVERLARAMGPALFAHSPFRPDAKEGDYAGMVNIAMHNETLRREREHCRAKAALIARVYASESHPPRSGPMAEPLTPEEAMREAFRLDVHTPHAILNRLRQMGYTVTPDPVSDATPDLAAALRPWLRHHVWCNCKTDDPPTTERCKCGLRAALASEPVPGFVPVRLYSGGVLADGTTNTEPIDFGGASEPVPATPDLAAALAILRAHHGTLGDDEHLDEAIHHLSHAAAIRKMDTLASEPVPATRRWDDLTPEEQERQRVEQAFIDGSVEGSPIDRDGNPLPATGNPEGPCICGENPPRSGKCVDINGDFWPGHGY